jgi:uncharacterized protein
MQVYDFHLINKQVTHWGRIKTKEMMLPLDAATLLIAVFAGSVLQAGVGIGFSIVVAPFMMIMLGTATAVPLLLLLNTLVSLVALDRASWKGETETIRLSIVGAICGIALGLAVYSLLSETTLLLLTASFLLVGLLLNLLPSLPVFGRNSVVAISGISGLTTAWAAMPGPLMIMGLLASGRTSKEARVLVQPIAFVAYGVAFALHGLINWNLVAQAPWLVGFIGSTLVGAFLGRVIGPYLPQQFIKYSICVISALACIALVRRAFLLG